MALARPTREPSTEIHYKKRTHDLVKRCRRALQIGEHELLDYRQFVGWLIVQKPHWSRPTWRQYKASVAFYLEREVALRHDPLAQEALEVLLPVDVEGCVSTTTRTSGSKLKRFPARDYRAIQEALDTHPGPWSASLQRWLAASVLTGLRPSEWGQCQLTEVLGEEALVVINAKQTNARAHGPTRTLLLGGLTQEERAIIRAHVDECTTMAKANTFKPFYHACAATLSRLSRRLWPKRQQHVTLYSARHQFSANAKASGLTREELAAMMGHAVDETATRHYGKKTAGLDMVRVRPDPGEVARVRSVFQPRFGLGLAPTPTLAPQLRPSGEGR